MPLDEVALPKRLIDLPLDARGFVVPAEAGWHEHGPEIKGVGQQHNFGLAYRRACAVCGYRLEVLRTLEDGGAIALRRGRIRVLEVETLRRHRG